MDRLLSFVRDLEPGVGTAVVVGGVGATAVSAGDEVDDGQAEAHAGALAGGVAPAKTVKRPLDEFGWEACALVVDVKLHPAVAAARDQQDLAATVEESVLDKVA